MRGALALIAAAVVGACGGGTSSSNGADIGFTTVARTNNSGVTEREGVVARSQSDFNTLWARYSANMSGAQAPIIDFNAVQVLGFFLGTRPNGCYSMSITRVRQAGDRLVVTYQEQVPGVGAVCTEALVNPGHLVAVPASQWPVEFAAE